MPGGMAPLKKPRNPTKLPLALNPTKSKDVLAVLAERNQAIVPVGAWVEPASRNCSEIPAHTSAYMIEEEIKEQQRRKQESLKHFQRQVKHRVNQQVKLRKKQQLQKSCKAAEKEGAIAMQCSNSAHLTPKRTSVSPSNSNTAMGSCMLPSSQVLGVATEEDGEENQNRLFEQQAQAVSTGTFHFIFVKFPSGVNILNFTCVYVWCICMYGCVCTCMDLRLASIVFPSCLLRRGLSLSLVPHSLSLPLICWDLYINHQLTWLFSGFWGSELQSSQLHSKLFTCGAIFPVPTSLFYCHSPPPRD
ncbi:Ccdc15 [Phodopus roborovskii]|uniref:Ccdc15 protein n=1 Tax=Phodopus roborovskii TaxID=109678 RepID=A0AAU9ZUU3_PHORO|nr:Ccdc15 [Phodopus roborovskii]